MFAIGPSVNNTPTYNDNQIEFGCESVPQGTYTRFLVNGLPRYRVLFAVALSWFNKSSYNRLRESHPRPPSKSRYKDGRVI